MRKFREDEQCDGFKTQRKSQKCVQGKKNIMKISPPDLVSLLSEFKRVCEARYVKHWIWEMENEGKWTG